MQMEKQVKKQIGKNDNILWVSKAGNSIAFKSVPGYQPVTIHLMWIPVCRQNQEL